MKNEYLYRSKTGAGSDFEITSEELSKLDVVLHEDASYHIISAKKGYVAKLKSFDFQRKEFVFQVDGKECVVNLQSPLESMIEKMGLNSGASKKEELIKAPMPGLVLDIKVSEGQSVKEGDPLLILEAMKMENIIVAAHDATIGSIHAKKGDSVEKAMVLLEFAP